jgi:hypothetical protein
MIKVLMAAAIATTSLSIFTTQPTNAAGRICLLYCPDMCTLEFSNDGSCSCKCNSYPTNVTIDVFRKAGIVDAKPTIQLRRDKYGNMSFAPTQPGDISNSGEAGSRLSVGNQLGGALGGAVPGANAYVASDHPDARPRETADQTHERLERERIIRGAAAAADAMRGELGGRGR